MTTPGLLPSVTGSSTRQINILLINPNGTSSMTEACLRSIESTLPPYVTVTGFTAPHPSPSAIEGTLDAVMSAAASARAVIPIAHNYDAFLVACFSAHPLIPALREELTQPVIGIMEASLYTSRMLGSRLSVLTTSPRSAVLHNESIAAYGLSTYSAGTESSRLGVLELESLPKDVVMGRMAEATKRLVERGADCIALGCAGMTEMREVCEGVVVEMGGGVRVIDGVGIGIQLLIAMAREGYETAKVGLYASSKVTREARGQDWL